MLSLDLVVFHSRRSARHSSGVPVWHHTGKPCAAMDYVLLQIEDRGSFRVEAAQPVKDTMADTPPQQRSFTVDDGSGSGLHEQLAENRSQSARQIEHQQKRPVGEPMSADQARRLTDNIKT